MVLLVRYNNAYGIDTTVVERKTAAEQATAACMESGIAEEQQQQHAYITGQAAATAMNKHNVVAIYSVCIFSDMLCYDYYYCCLFIPSLLLIASHRAIKNVHNI